MKFNLGETVYWVESGTNYGKKIPCPMCFGKRFVTIVLGDDSNTKIECGFCSHGLERATGTAQSWEPHAVVRSGVITGISQRDGIRYEVDSRGLFEHEVYANEGTAKLVRDEIYKEVLAQAEEYFRDSFITCKKKQIWSAGYHRSCIASAERTIQWHQLRLGMLKETKSGDPA